MTPLHIASFWGKSEIVKALLQYGINISVCVSNEKDNSGLTPLHYASKFGYSEIVKALLSGLESQRVPTKNLQHNANCNEKNNVGCTPLHIASFRVPNGNGRLEIVQELLKHHVNIDEKNDAGWSPLHVASFCRYSKIVQELLPYCDRFIRDNGGKTASEIAETEEITAPKVDFLIENYYDPLEFKEPDH